MHIVELGFTLIGSATSPFGTPVVSHVILRREFSAFDIIELSIIGLGDYMRHYPGILCSCLRGSQ